MRRLLVVDDELGMREMLTYQLSQEGFEVVAADGGQAAIAAVAARKFDLVLSDLKMPGIDGVELVKRLKNVDPDLEVIVGTGYQSVETAVACMKQGAFDYISKPYDLAELLSILDRAAEKNHLQGAVALYEASRALLSTVSMPEVISLVAGQAGRVLKASAIGLLVRREEAAGFDVHRANGVTDPSDEVLVALSERALRKGAPLLLPDEGGFPPEVEGRLASALVYPLLSKGRQLGSLSILRGSDLPAFSPSELQRGSIFSAGLALALDNAHLYGALRSKIEELVSTRELLILREKAALAGELAGAVAHEINNPLAFVQSNLEALRDYSTRVGSLWLAARTSAEYLATQSHSEASLHAKRLLDVVGTNNSDQLVQDIAEVIAELLEGVRRIADLVTGLQHLSGLEDQKAPERFDLAQLTEECLLILDPARRNGGGLPITQAAGSSPMAIAARDDARTAILSVLTFLQRGKANVQDRAFPSIAVELSAKSGQVELRLYDTSLELSSEQLARAFSPRVEPCAGSSSTMRMNLGLALSYQLLRRNGGEMKVGRNPPGGTEFRLLFPSGANR